MKAKVAKKLVSSLAASAVLVSAFAACDLGLTPYVATTDAGPETIVDSGNNVIDTGAVDAGSDSGDAGDASTGPKRIFVTSTRLNSTFGNQPGQAGADGVCNTLATAAKLNGRFVAWISETGNKDAIDHLTDVGPWYLVDRKTLIFATKAATLVGPITKINLDENGAAVANSERVWTGTLATGRVAGGSNLTCADWTTIGFAGNASGVSGTILNDRSGDWTQAVSEPCFSGDNHLYCFEQ